MASKIWSKVKKMAKTIAEPESSKLKEWKGRFETAKALYGDTRSTLKELQGYYDGTRTMRSDPNTGAEVSKVATNVRNIVYELVESEVDTSIPMPKVRAIHPEDEELAQKIEHLLENKVKMCNLTNLNDLMERNVPILGGDYFHVQWDTSAGLHSQVGDVKVTEVHPKKLIPQPGVVNFDDMDYFFIQEVMTKKTVKKVYGVDVTDASNDDTEIAGGIEDATTNDDLVTVNTAYYRNDDHGVGVYTWCDRFELLDMEDFEARHLDRCIKCGTVMIDGKCPNCGGTKSKKSTEDYEELVDAIEVRSDFRDEENNPINMQVDPYEDQELGVLDENGQPVLDEGGQPVTEIKKTKKKIPYYKPNCYPVVLRKNITANDRLLGGSDTEAIIDQQDTIKKLGTKINEKLLKGGSYVTLPRGVKVETNDKELKIIRVSNANEASLINVINVQPNVSNDETFLSMNYDWAKNTLGITDAYQGKFQASETSGTARQYAINQAAGRLESKRVMKNQAYAKLYEIMFKFWLAYADQTQQITSQQADGTQTYDEIDRHEFLRLDAAGEFYWDDEFIFDTDPTSTLMMNREALWSQADQKLQSGAFGQIGELETMQTYWTFMKASGYPNAGMALDAVKQRMKEQQEQLQTQQMAAMQQGMQDAQAQQEGEQSEMPSM